MTNTPLDNAIASELSRPVTVENLKIGATDQTIKATDEECSNLADRFGLKDLAHLEAHLHLIRKGQGESLRVFVTGDLSARVTQTCIITLETVDTEIEAKFTIKFDIAGEDDDFEAEIDSDEDEIIEPILNGVIDLGELVAQNLALEINPFPRAEGADSSEMVLESKDSTTNPFSALEKLKNKQN
jgi:uncharacterized metal-binding protein YceD (DUF177 family)